MNLAETLKLAFAAIWAHKLRSFLTLLGMIIGVAAFMTVLSVLQGFNLYVDEKIAGIGSNSFTVRRFNFLVDFKDTDSIAAAQRRNKELTFEEMEYIKSRAQLIDKIGAKALGNSADIKRGAVTMEGISVEGMQPVIGEIEKLDIEDGRFFTDLENEGAVRVCYIGKDVADKLFPFGSPIGQEIDIRGIPYKVVGVQTAKGTVFGMPQDNFVYVPIKTFAANFGPLRGSRSLYYEVSAKSENLFKDAVEEVRTLLRVRHKLATGEKDDFGILTPDAITGLRDSVLGPTYIVILLVPGIALIVGAIVIMNIMLVAVTERTKEIGIRKSLGARQGDILKQFLMEAVTLSLIGGLIGLSIAWLGGKIISLYIFQTYIPLWAVFVGIFVPAIIGVVSGLFPAWKAARLDPIEALRAD
jgi:putative ABC transport system permease protein